MLGGLGTGPCISLPSAADETEGIWAPLPLQHGVPSQSQDREAGKSWSFSEKNHGKADPGSLELKEGPHMHGVPISHSQGDYGHLVDSDP